MHRLFLAVLTAPALWGQTPVPALVPNTTRHARYLFNRFWTYDGQDYTGLPWLLYYVNVGESPPPGTLRTQCTLQAVNGAPYDHATFGWFRFPAPNGPDIWPPADGTEPLAATGEYLETSQIGPVGATSPIGFVFNGEFGGEANPASKPDPPYTHYFLETVYFTDRECSDGGMEYGFYRTVADSDVGDTPANAFAFYYSTFNNCNLDYGCWDVLGHQVHGSFTTTSIRNVAANTSGTYQYKFQVTRSGATFNVAILDPGSGHPVTCQWAFPTETGTGGGNGPCRFAVPIVGFYASPEQLTNGYIVVATQSSHLYPESYDYSSFKLGGAPPTNIVPTHEPNGSPSCVTNGSGFACLKAISLDVLFP